MHWGFNPLPPQKHHPPLFLAKSPLNLQTVQAPLFLGDLAPLYWFFGNPQSRICQ